jgi:hypothetical protein
MKVFYSRVVEEENWLHATSVGEGRTAGGAVGGGVLGEFRSVELPSWASEDHRIGASIFFRPAADI